MIIAERRIKWENGKVMRIRNIRLYIAKTLTRHAPEINISHRNIGKKKAAEERINALNEKQKQKVEEVIALTPRILNIIAVANRCINAGFIFPSAFTTCEHGYGDGRHSFIADGITHHVGFMNCKKASWKHGECRYKRVEYVGFYNGGACGPYDLYVKANEVFSKHEETGEVSTPRISDLDAFLGEFPVFEAAFYRWLEGYCKGV